MTERTNSFSPVIDRNSRILILGSMPGAESLRKHEYYANSRNLFWKIIYGVFGSEPSTSYTEKISFILSKGIALWDVIESCERTGSLDSDIKNEQCNDFNKLFREYPGIRYVLFNGAKAYDTYRKHIGFSTGEGREFLKMPSTSPAHAVKFQDKLKEWMVIREYHQHRN